jgi:fumarate hydratase class II
MEYRIEHDSMGEVRVPSAVYWGAQTERSRTFFRIGQEASMPKEIIRAYAYVKKAAAEANSELGAITPGKKDLISAACDEILEGKLDDQFPLVIWQSGSGTHTNMNVNEVIANRGHVLNGGRLDDKEKILHPNDDVNRSQSTNDTFPTAMHIAAHLVVSNVTLPGLQALRDSLDAKSKEYNNVLKIGRTHFMDAVPLTLGQELSGYVHQVENSMRSVRNALEKIRELALGGTAVGTGLNAPEGYAGLAAKKIAGYTGIPFISSPNKFEAEASQDAMVELSSALKRSAVSVMKIANDIMMLSSGPRCGIGELIIPDNEPGSSIMPGKVNPTQSDSLKMVCAQVMGNDFAVTIAGAGGQFELNTFKPMIAFNILLSARILGDGCLSFSRYCVDGMKPNYDRIKSHLQNSLMLITALTPYLGYENCAKIARKAYRENTSLKEAATALNLITSREFDRLMSQFWSKTTQEDAGSNINPEAATKQI